MTTMLMMMTTLLMMMITKIMMKYCLLYRVLWKLLNITCMTLSTCMCSAIYLYDAVYLYLLTVNQTLAEGYPDYRDGHLIFNKTIGQRFTG